MAERKLKVVLLGKDQGLGSALGKAGRQADGLHGKLSKAGSGLVKGMAAGAAGAGAIGAALVVGGFKDLARLETIAAQSSAVVKSTGGAAGVAAKDVRAYADAIEAKTGIESESIQSAENLLLTFTDIKNGVGKGNDIFNQATQIATDMSVAMGTDAKGSAIMLGKALNNPVAGMAALSKVGVTFTEGQKKQVKAMAEAGDTMGGQKVILAELNKEFGGSAEAFGGTTQGKIEKMKNKFGDLGETLATALLPIALKVGTWLADNLPKAIAKAGDMFNAAKPKFLAVKNALVELWNKLEPVRNALAGFVRNNPGPVLAGLAVIIGGVLTVAFASWAVSVLAATWPIILIVGAIALLVGGLVWAYQNVGWFHDAVDKVGAFIRDTLWPILQGIAGWFTDTFVPAIASVAMAIKDFVVGAKEKWDGFYAAFVTGKDELVAGFDALVSFFADLPGKVGDALGGLADAMSAPFRAGAQAIRDVWNSTIGGKGVTIPDIPGLPGRGRTFTIPTLHTGGIFDSGQGEGLAVLKDGEGVFTRGQMAALGGAPPAASGRSGGSAGPHITVIVNTRGVIKSDRDLGREIRQALVVDGRASGNRSLLSVLGA